MDNDNLELKDGTIWLSQDIKKALQEVYDHYRNVYNRNEYLTKENERLKSESYKDEELSKMRTNYEAMKSDYYRGFPISEEDDKKIKEWVKKQMEKNPSIGGAIGGRFKYEFIPTGVGTVGTVIDTFTQDRFTFCDL